MKNLILSCVFLTMMSCYSYKSIASNDFVIGKDYKITDTDGVDSEIRIVGLKQDSLVIQRQNLQSTISKNDIVSSKQRKFSYLQTGGFVLGAVGGPLVLLAAIMSNSIK